MNVFSEFWEPFQTLVKIEHPEAIYDHFGLLAPWDTSGMIFGEVGGGR